MLTQVNVKFDGFSTYDVQPQVLPDVFANRPVIVFGKYKGSPSGKVTLTVKGLVNELYLDDLRAKTHRGLEGRVARGMSAGGRIFGYRTVAVADDASAGKRDAPARFEIDEREAGVVRQIVPTADRTKSTVQVKVSFRALDEHWQGPSEELAEIHISLNKLLDLDLAIIEDAYQAAYAARLQQSERLAAIVRERGKMHNPVTGSGGMLIGTVREVGRGRSDLRPGDRVEVLIERRQSPDGERSLGRILAARVEVGGSPSYAFAFEPRL